MTGVRKTAAGLAVLLALLGPAGAAGVAPGPAQVYSYFAPEEDLALIDTRLFAQAGAGSAINLACYVLSDRQEIAALADAAARGAWLRIYLDAGQLKQLRLTADHPLARLAASPNAEIRVKHAGRDLMHLKGYTINGALLRTGSANMSASGLERQDNDLELIYSKVAARRFDGHFEAMWDRPDNLAFASFIQTR